MPQDKEQSLVYKEKGNNAFKEGKHQEAIDFFSKAIECDDTNHVFFSNRSACYAKLEKYDKALEDADQCIKVNPTWPKGYTRKGAALEFMGRNEDALEAYNEGLKHDSDNQVLKDNAQNVQKKLSNNMQNVFGNMLNDPQLWTKIRQHSSLSQHANDPDFINKVNAIQKSPQLLQTYMQSDRRIMELLGMLIGADVKMAGGDDTPQPMQEDTPSSSSSEPKKESKKSEPEPEPELTEEEKEKKEKHEEAEKLKAEGNAHYKKKEFDQAIEYYDKALEIEPENIVYLTNKAAVYFGKKDYDECIKLCEKAIEIGQSTFADFKQVAKAYARIGNAYAKMEKYDEAIQAYKDSLTEHRDSSVSKKLQQVEKTKRQKEAEAYIDPEKAVEAKNRGNELFKQGKFPEAVKEYTEAIRRDPKYHIPYSNRSAAYMKLGEYPLALKDADKCLELDENFVKAYIRKGHCHFFLKEYHKALETYDKGMKIDNNNVELMEGSKRVIQAINSDSGDDDETRAQRAMYDPEIQEILGDPGMQQVLQDLKNNPQAASSHLSDPKIKANIDKLIAAGIIKTK
eukprot:gb/GECH01012863.1/.p1 GENE.gb/GECH01012863.1/~~gb/GECH01012863.1/.p1  ORF type:complete len:568 (+),score=202.42 gb/GECH01012863.1/:1-1704(+)